MVLSGKRIGWQSLAALAEHDRTHIDELVRRADAQLERVHDIHLRVALERGLE